MNAEERIDYYIKIVNQYPHIAANFEGELEVITDKDILLKEQENLYLKAKEKHQPLHWYNIGVVSEDVWTIVLRDLVKFPNGTYGGYVRMLNKKSQLEKSGKDVVILVSVDNKLLIMKHFRHDDRQYHWECPRGFGESNLSAKENAEKEIQEETGLHIDSIIQLNNPEESIAYFYANCSGSFNCTDDLEAIDKVKYITDSDFCSMIADGGINDQYTIKAYILAKIKRLISKE